MRELHAWHGDYSRDASDATADALTGRPRDGGDATVDAPANQPESEATTKPHLQVIRDPAVRRAKYLEYQQKVEAAEAVDRAEQPESSRGKRPESLKPTRDRETHDPETKDAVNHLPAETATEQKSADADRGVTCPERSDVESLRKRAAELEADKEARDQRIAAQDEKIAAQDKTIAELRSTRAEQDKRIARLEAEFSQVAVAVSELKQRAEDKASKGIAERAGGGETERGERAERQSWLRFPTDAINNVLSAAAGGTLTELAYHVKDLSPEYAGVGASALTVGAGVVAVWRERRKAKDDADHRPEG
jgi:uncharacterized coiled-coil protein SlyX